MYRMYSQKKWQDVTGENVPVQANELMLSQMNVKYILLYFFRSLEMKMIKPK